MEQRIQYALRSWNQMTLWILGNNLDFIFILQCLYSILGVAWGERNMEMSDIRFGNIRT